MKEERFMPKKILKFIMGVFGQQAEMQRSDFSFKVVKKLYHPAMNTRAEEQKAKLPSYLFGDQIRLK